LPDGLFSNQNPTLGKFCVGLPIEDISALYGHLVYKRIVRPFGIFCGFYGHYVYFYGFGLLDQEKSGNPEAHS
jgi:hypothetical protein